MNDVSADERIKAALGELPSVRAASVPVLVKVEVRALDGALLEVLDFRVPPRG